MKLLSIAYKLITAHIVCQIIMLTGLHPALPLRKLPLDPVQQAALTKKEQEKKAMTSKLTQLGAKLGALKNNLSTLKQRLSDLKQKLSVEVKKTPPSSIPSSPGKGPAIKTLDEILNELKSSDAPTRSNILKNLRPQRLKNLSDKIGTTPELQVLKQEVDAVIAGKPTTTQDKPTPIKLVKKPVGATGDLLEEIAKGKKLTSATEIRKTPFDILIDQLIAAKNDTNTLDKILGNKTLPALRKLREALGYQEGALTQSLKKENELIVARINFFIESMVDPAWLNFPKKVSEKQDTVKEGLSEMSLGDNISYAFARTATSKSTKEDEMIIQKIKIEGQTEDILFTLARSVVNDVKGDNGDNSGRFMNNLHKKIIETWLAQFKNALLNGSPDEAKKYLKRTIDLCDESRSNSKQDKVDFYPNPQAEIADIFAQIVDSTKAQALAEAGLDHVQKIIASKTTK